MSAQNNRVHHGEDDGTARHSVATALATSTLATAPVAGHAGSVGPASNAKATDVHGPAINTAALPAARPSRPRPLSRLSGLPLKISSLRKGSSRLVTPTDATAEPLGLLVVRILAARSLTAKDRNGRSDPFLHIRVGQGRAESEVVKVGVACDFSPVDVGLTSLSLGLPQSSLGRARRTLLRRIQAGW